MYCVYGESGSSLLIRVYRLYDIFGCTYVYISSCIYTYTTGYTYTSLAVFIYLQLYLYISSCTYIRISGCTYISPAVFIYLQLYLYTYHRLYLYISGCIYGMHQKNPLLLPFNGTERNKSFHSLLIIFHDPLLIRSKSVHIFCPF